jgi:hypothetical protein
MAFGRKPLFPLLLLLMRLFLSWAYALAAIASVVAALKTGQYGLFWGVPIAIGALFTVSFAPVARSVLLTAVRDTAVPAPLRAVARLLTRFSFALILLWPVSFTFLLFNDFLVGAWLVGTYIVASNTIRMYRAKYLGQRPSMALPGMVAPGETAAMLKALIGSKSL